MHVYAMQVWNLLQITGWSALLRMFITVHHTCKQHGKCNMHICMYACMYRIAQNFDGGKV